MYEGGGGLDEDAFFFTGCAGFFVDGVEIVERGFALREAAAQQDAGNESRLKQDEEARGERDKQL